MKGQTQHFLAPHLCDPVSRDLSPSWGRDVSGEGLDAILADTSKSRRERHRRYDISGGSGKMCFISSDSCSMWRLFRVIYGSEVRLGW